MILRYPCLKRGGSYVLESRKLKDFQMLLSSHLEGLLNRQKRASGHLSPAEESVQLPESCAQDCEVTAFMDCHLSCGGAFSDAPAPFTTSPAVLRHPASARSPLHIPIATPVTTHGLTNVNLPAASLCSVHFLGLREKCCISTGRVCHTEMSLELTCRKMRGKPHGMEPSFQASVY